MFFKILIVLIIVVITNSCSNISSQNYEIKVDVIFDKSIDNKDLKIVVNPYGYLLDGYELKKYIGKTNNYTVLFKEGRMQNYKKEDINTFSDYYIYAKYKNQYAKMKYTNSLVMGSNQTDIRIFINIFDNLVYLSSSETVLSPEAIHQNSFKNKQDFDQVDTKFLKILDDLN
ncbi:hypothetical protein PYR74_22665 [Acinetobacter bereziniae]|nr:MULTISPECIES: hypothetical protein [Acinetobacter]MBJ8425340.1 hypothetical protein [Acinetobacter bereziniae]MBJ8474057.1 hypothetical protein [Acinetobacter bereziniae]WEI22613.1 hypothetical protein PYR74_22665 [Acinetobacter bereziniae]